MAGDWLGFGWTKDEHYKLARIRVEVPNALDQDWAIDVTKSRALPPAALRDELRRIAEATRSVAKRIFTHRGAKLTPRADQDRVLLWVPTAKHNKTFYRLNREHPLLTAAMQGTANRAALYDFYRQTARSMRRIALHGQTKKTTRRHRGRQGRPGAA